MGFFDSLVTSIENGQLEKTITGAIDTAEAKLDNLVNSTEQLVDKTEELANKAKKNPGQSDSVASEADS